MAAPRPPTVLLGRPFHPSLHPIAIAALDVRAVLPEPPELPSATTPLPLAALPHEALVAAGRAHSPLVLLVHGHVKVDDALLASFPTVRVVSNHGVGVDHIDVDAATRRGVLVGNTPGLLTETTADMAWGLLMASARNLVRGHGIATAADTVAFSPYDFGVDVHGATLGLVGFGRIGQAIARRGGCGFGMRVLYHCRHRVSGAEEAAVTAAVPALPPAEHVPVLVDLLRRCDFVVLALPGSPATAGLIGAAELAAMRPHARLVNIGRGVAVDHDALADALARGVLGGAALDVTHPEPLPRDHPLLRCPQAIISPHWGSATAGTREAMVRAAVANAVAGARGDPAAMVSCLNAP
jgi:glyoxylate reductase